MDLSVVSCAWHAEFLRMRRVTVTPSAVVASIDSADGHPDPLGKVGGEIGAADAGAGGRHGPVRAALADGSSRKGTVVVGRLAAAGDIGLTVGGSLIPASVCSLGRDAAKEGSALVEFFLPTSSSPMSASATSVEVAGSFLKWKGRIPLQKGVWRSGSISSILRRG